MSKAGFITALVFGIIITLVDLIFLGYAFSTTYSSSVKVKSLISKIHFCKMSSIGNIGSSLDVFK
jgi:hypothetical protein